MRLKKEQKLVKELKKNPHYNRAWQLVPEILTLPEAEAGGFP